MYNVRKDLSPTPALLVMDMLTTILTTRLEDKGAVLLPAVKAAIEAARARLYCIQCCFPRFSPAGQMLSPTPNGLPGLSEKAIKHAYLCCSQKKDRVGYENFSGFGLGAIRV